MGDLALDTRVEGGDGSYRARISPEWAIWGPNGGYLGALALRAVAQESSLPRVASYYCHYLNVADFDDAEIEVMPLRRSRRAESLRVSMRQGERPIIEAFVWLVDDGPGIEHEASPLPDVEGPDALIPWTDGEEVRTKGFPFWRNIDARMIGWDGRRWEEREAGPPLRQEWFRFRPRATFTERFLDEARALIVIDTIMFPAAAMAHASPIDHVAPSLDVAVWFHGRAPHDEWLFSEGVSPVARHGLVGGSARLWSKSGVLVASGGQQMLCRPMPGTP